MGQWRGSVLHTRHPDLLPFQRRNPGLVEAGVGLVPAGCGTKETLRRLVNPVMKVPGADVLPHLQKAFEQIAMGKVSESAVQGKEMGYLGANDRIIMNQDYLLAEAKETALNMVEEGYQPPIPAKIWAVNTFSSS